MDQKHDKELNFSAISDGLGFHPFADGLPYAPVTKSKTDSVKPQNPLQELKRFSSGSGAVSAGPAVPSPDFFRPSMPTAPSKPRVSVPVAPPSSAGPSAQNQQSAAPSKPLIPEHRYGFVYLFKRVLAYALDTTLNLSICVTGLSMVLIREDVDPQILANSEIVLLTTFFLIFFNWAIITSQEMAFGTTVGKRIFGLTLQGSAAAAFVRAFFFLISVGFLGTGLLWALFDRRRRCWHDVAVDMQPEEIARL